MNSHKTTNNVLLSHFGKIQMRLRKILKFPSKNYLSKLSGKFTRNEIFCSPSFEKLIWRYYHANVDSISKAIEGLDWNKPFSNKIIDKKVSVFTETFLHIMNDFFPNKVITINGKYSPWVNNKIKILIKNRPDNK